VTVVVDINQWVDAMQKAKELCTAGCSADVPDSELKYHYVDELGLEHVMDGEFAGDRAPLEPGPEIQDEFP